ncbi:MAG: nuclear transport factor 2 family protein [Pseudomonadales bacterium]|nr:nuclear transport factor 2 family protein [Pseudomonadales bacterium]
MLKIVKTSIAVLLCSLSVVVFAAKDAKVVAVENYMKALNTADIEIIKSMYAKNATVEDPVGTPLKEGHEAVVKFYAEGAFKGNLSAELSGPVRVAGDSAAFSFNVIFNGMKMEIIDVFEFNQANEVVSMKAYWSNANITPLKK